MSHIDRRRFNSILAGLGLASVSSAFGGSGLANEPEVLRIPRNGWTPNNEHLPVLLYRNVIATSGRTRRRVSKRYSFRTVGRPSGAMGFMTSITIIRWRMRCWAWRRTCAADAGWRE